MKHLSNIPLICTTKGDVLSGNPLSRVVLSSASSNWHNLVVEELHVPKRELDDVMFIQHVVVVNVGRPVTFEVTKDGRSRCVLGTDAISLFPSHQSFFSRRKREENGPAHVILVALDPVFVIQIAAALEVDSDRVELVEQRSGTDPMLRHIVMALHAGLQSGCAGDQMYGESLSNAFAVHLLRKYGGTAMGVQRLHGGLSREKLMRAIEYIQDQLDANLTVSGIARTVHMSPDHFARLFKQSTGLSPYGYVMKARTKRAKELLTSGKFSISDIAYKVGFSDQSHLTRHVKHVFGITPKMLQQRPDLEQDSSKEPREDSINDVPDPPSY